jgi:hypothetical protein
MSFHTIACLDDLTRRDIGPDCELIYDLIRVPVWQATGLDIAKSPRDGQRHNLGADFTAARFQALCGLPQRPWSTLHHRVPPQALAYLDAALPPHTLVIGAAMPPWLTRGLDAAGRDWISLAIAPADFGADRWFGVRASAALRPHLAAQALQSDDLLAQACLRAASVRHRRRRAAVGACWDGTLVWVAQAADDPALLDADGRSASVADHADALRAAAEGRRLVHLAAAGDPAGAEQERALLARLTGQPVPSCTEDLTELLAMDDDVAFFGLNAPALQDAAWFGKDALALLPPPADDTLLLPARAVLEAPLWAAVTGGRPGGMATSLLPADTLRRLLTNRPATPGLPAAADPSPDLAQALDVERQRVDDLRLEIEGLKEALRVVLRQASLQATLARRPEPAHV